MALSRKPIEIVEEGKHKLLSKANHWQRVYLKEIATVQNGFAFSSSQFNKLGGMPLIRIRDIDSFKTEDYFTGKYDDEYIVNQGDILIGMDGDFKAAYWKGLKALLNQRVCRIHLDTKLYNRAFLFYCLQPFLDAIHAETSSVTVKHLSSVTIQDLPLPLPPLNEQNRIVDKLDELLSELEKGKEQLQTSLEQLKVYRQSILKHAFEGRLFNPDLNENELPEGWIRESFNDVSIKIGDIDHKMPKKVDNGIYPYISTGDITDENELDFTKAKRITKEDYTILSRKIKPEKDDIIFPRYGTIGRNVIVKTDKEFLVSYSCAIIKPNKDKILPKYLYYYSLSPQIKKEIEKHIVQTTQANVGISSIKSFEIYYPILLDDQELIVSKIDHILSSAKKSEDEILTNLSKVDSLKQSLLQKAFEGKLVKQDPTDEPASVLLGKIKKEREEYLKAEKEKKKIQKKPMKKKSAAKVFEFPLLDNIKDKFGKKSFTFEQLKSEVGTNYDDLREELFSLLDNEEVLAMEFDQKKESMNFKYVGK